MNKIAVFLLIVFVGVFFLGKEAPCQQKAFTLEECIQIALKNNSQLKNAERRVHSAGTGVTLARSNILPSLTSSFSSSRAYQAEQGPYLETIPIYVGGRFVGLKQRTAYRDPFYRNTHSARITLGQNIYDGGKWWNRIKKANADYRASEYDYTNTKQFTIFSVTQRFYELLKAIKLQEVYERAVESSQEQLKKTESMYEIGSVAQVDVYKARVSLGNDKINLINQKNQVLIARANLNLVLGRNSNEPIDIVKKEVVIEPFEMSLQEAIATAIRNNPEIKNFEENVKSSKYALKVAKGDYLPSIGIGVTYSRYNTDFDRVYGGFDKNYGLTVGAQISWNLFNGFQTQANIERESINYHISKENLIERKRSLQSEIEQAYWNLKAYQEIIDIDKDNLAAAEEDLRLAQERYRVGAGTLLEVIDAQVALTRAKSTLVRAKYDTIIAQAQLRAAMGVLED